MADVVAGHRVLVRGVTAGMALACLAFSISAPGGASAHGAPDLAPAIQRGPAISPSQFPNDPGFAPCESQDANSGCGDSDEWKLFGPLTGDTCLAPGGTVADQPHPDGGLPCWATNATDPDGSAGVDETGAWAQGNMGRPDVRIG